MSTDRVDADVRALRLGGLALAVAAGAILSQGCERSSETPPVSAADVREEAREAGATASAYMQQELANLEARVESATRDAENEIAKAREQAAELPEEARSGLSAAIERTERARDHVGREFAELKRAGDSAWDTTRQRVTDALDELAEARREVTAALSGETSAG